MRPQTFIYGGQCHSIPAYMLGGLERYLTDGIDPGDFLQAVIDNDFVRACGRADEENLANLPAYADFLYNHTPASAWGSRKARLDWMAQHKTAREAATLGDTAMLDHLRKIVEAAA